MGRVKKSTQKTGNVTYGEDDLNLGRFPMTYDYNLAGMLIEQQYPSGRKVKNTPDPSGDLQTVESKRNGVA